MADKTLKVTLDAKDNASATFAKVGNSAQTMGQAIAKSGDTASRSMDKTAISAKEMQTAMERGYKAGQQIGIGLLALGAASAAAGKMFRDQQIGLETLQRNYGDAADEMQRFADEMQRTTNFSNDAVISAANNAATLARNYGFTADEIQRVLQISADLAASKGISLEAATQAVTSALRGEAEAAEQLGLTLNQQSIDREGLTRTMTNQEAAHFRLAAAISQSAFAEGAAAQQADTTYGTLTRLSNGLQDLIQDYGGFLSVAGEVGAFMADHPAQMLAAAAAMKALQVAAIGVKGAYSALNSVGALGGLTALLTGPVGIVAAAGAAVVGIGLLARYLTDDYTSATETATKATKDFAASIVEMGQAGTLTLLTQQIAQQGLILGQYATDQNAVADSTEKFRDEMVKLQTELSGPGSAMNAHTKAVTDKLTAEQIALIDGIQMVNGAIVQGNEDGQLSFEELQLAIDNTGASLTNTGESAQDYADAWASASEDVVAIMKADGKAAVDAQQQVLADLRDVQAGTMTMGEAAADIAEIRAAMEAEQAATFAATGALDGHAGALDRNTTAVQRYLDALRQPRVSSDADAIGMGVVSTIDALKEADKERAKAAADAYKDTQVFSEATNQGRYNLQQWVDAHDQKVAAMEQGIAVGQMYVDALDRQQETAEQGIKAYTAEVEKLKTTFADTFHEMQRAVNAPIEAMAAGQRIVIGNTNAIAQQSQQLADWAEGLIAAEGEYSKLDDLVKAGRISGESGVFTGMSEYAQAQQAYNSIMQDNAAIQEHVLTIQAKQAPMLAEMESNLESYMASLADATPEQQAFALAMMDSSTATQAFDLATGLIENRDVFGPMAESLANLNPYLGETLVQMGLMNKTYDESTGTFVYTLKVDGGDTALSQTQQLTNAIEALNKTFTITLGIEVPDPWTAIGDKLNPFGNAESPSGPTITFGADTSAVETAVRDVNGLEVPEKRLVVTGDNSAAVTALDTVNTTAVPDKMLTINAADHASGAINAVNDMTVNDKYMTIYATTVYSSIGTPGLGLRHGGIAGYAHGGIPVELAEAGSELLHFAGGGTMPIYNHGYYTVPPMTYVSPANTGTAGGRGDVYIDFSGATFNGTSRAEMDNWAETSLVPNLRKVLQDERAGYWR